MDTARYYLAVLMVVSLPPAVVFWYVAHPLAGFWRGVGPWVTYTVLMGSLFGGVWGLALVREALVGADMGMSWWLAVPGLALYGSAIVVEIKARKYLKFKILVGLPEFAPDRMESKLLEEGIYARIRHPRYAGIMLATIGWALITNYSGVYVMAALTFPGLYVITVMEERELLQRLGDEYRRYRERVPRFVPRLG